MSTHHSLVLFQGDQMQRLPEIFGCFDYTMTDHKETVSGMETIWERTNWPLRTRPRDTVHKAVLSNGLWTGVLDREMSLITQKKKCQECAKKFGIKIFGYFSESVSGSCGFYLFNPMLQREFFMQDNEVVVDEGDPLPEEAGLTLDNVIESGVMTIARHIGFPDTLFGDPKIKVLIVELQFRLESKNLDLTHNPSHRKPEEKKNWWRFW